MLAPAGESMLTLEMASDLMPAITFCDWRTFRCLCDSFPFGRWQHCMISSRSKMRRLTVR